MLKIFTRKIKYERDIREAERALDKYGYDAPLIYKKRSKDKTLSKRERAHWKRIYRIISNKSGNVLNL